MKSSPKHQQKHRKWDESFDLLLAWQKLHGHLQVPARDPTIGTWFHNQRALYWRKQRRPEDIPARGRRISEMQIKRLEEIGMTWNAPYRAVRTDDDQPVDKNSSFKEMDRTARATTLPKKRQYRSSSAARNIPAATSSPEKLLLLAGGNDAPAIIQASKSTQLGTKRPACSTQPYETDDDVDDALERPTRASLPKNKRQRGIRDSQQQQLQQQRSNSFHDRKERLIRYLREVPNVISEAELLELTTTTEGFTESELDSLVQDAAMVPRRTYVLAARHRRLHLQETGGRLLVPEQPDGIVKDNQHVVRPVDMAAFREVFGEKVKERV